VASALRREGIVSEVYFDDAKVAKKLNYANKLDIPYVLLIGEEEIQKGMVSLKDMKTGSQESLTVEEAIKILK